jgi:hypothetical protein
MMTYWSTKMSSGRNADTSMLGDVDELADLQVDGDTTDGIALLASPAARSVRWSIIVSSALRAATEKSSE